MAAVKQALQEKLGHTQADPDLQIRDAHTHADLMWCIRMRTHTCTSFCAANRAVMWHSRMGWSVGLLSSAWEAVPSSSLLTCPSYGNSSTSVSSLSLLLALRSPLPLTLSLPLSLSRGCSHSHSVQMNIGTSDGGSSVRERCKEPRGAPMAPPSHLLSPSPSTTSRTPTPNPSLSPSPCPCPSTHAAHQSTRTRPSGGRRCPVTTSPRGLWTCMHGPPRMRVRSHCLRTGKWPTQRPAWSIS